MEHAVSCRGTNLCLLIPAQPWGLLKLDHTWGVCQRLGPSWIGSKSRCAQTSCILLRVTGFEETSMGLKSLA